MSLVSRHPPRWKLVISVMKTFQKYALEKPGTAIHLLVHHTLKRYSVHSQVLTRILMCQEYSRFARTPQ